MSKQIIQSNKQFIGYYDTVENIKNPFKRLFMRIALIPYTFMGGYVPLYEKTILYYDTQTNKFEVETIIE